MGTDNQGRGPALNEGRVERMTSRPNENRRDSDGKKQATDKVAEQVKTTGQRVADTLKK